MYSSYDIEKSYLPQKCIFLNILFVKIQFQEVKNSRKIFI